MHLQPQTVAEAVAEVFSEARRRYYAGGGVVHLLRRYTRFCLGYSRLLGGKDRIIYLKHLIRGLAHTYRTRGVGAVALPEYAEIQGQKALGYNLVRGHAVGHAGALRRNHDGVKGLVRAAESKHVACQLRRQLLFRHAPLKGGDCPAEGLLGHPLGLYHYLQLLRAFDSTQLVQYALGGDELRHEAAGESVVFLPGHHALLEAQAFDLAIQHPVREIDIVPLPLYLHDLTVLYGVLGGLHISGIREEPGFAFRDEGYPVGGRKASGISAVILSRDQQRVHVAVF